MNVNCETHSGAGKKTAAIVKWARKKGTKNERGEFVGPCSNRGRDWKNVYKDFQPSSQGKDIGQNPLEGVFKLIRRGGKGVTMTRANARGSWSIRKKEKSRLKKKRGLGEGGLQCLQL